jgi:HD superfamily phosphohydrolase YqeK
MNKDILTDLQNWFNNYVNSFYGINEVLTRNIKLKQIHTTHVCENIILIAKSLSQSKEQLIIAEIAALFHDVGRFKQVAVYGTFEDRKSENHGVLGYKILKESGVLNQIPEKQAELILTAVKYHNALKLPDKLDKDSISLLKMLRDADKLDIWRVFLEFFELHINDRHSASGFELPDINGYNSEAIKNIFNKKVVLVAHLTSLNDIKLMQLSWIFDLNFKETFRFMIERDYINKILASLPDTEEIRRLNIFLHQHVNQLLREWINE